MKRDTVAVVLNTSTDVIDLLRHTLEHAGIVTFTAFTHEVRDGAVDFDAFIGQCGNEALSTIQCDSPYDSTRAPAEICLHRFPSRY